METSETAEGEIRVITITSWLAYPPPGTSITWSTEQFSGIVARPVLAFMLLSQRKRAILPVGNQHSGAMKRKTDVLQGTLALMVLKTLHVLGPLHGYGIARRIEQISGDLLSVNQGTLYPVLLKLEQEGAI